MLVYKLNYNYYIKHSNPISNKGENKMIKIPSRGSQDELDFEKEFEEELSKKCN